MADYSGSVTLGGTAQTAAAADVNRMSLTIQNPSDTDIWVAFGATAVADSPSFLIEAGANAEYGPMWREMTTKAISVIGATTGKKYTIHDTKG